MNQIQSMLQTHPAPITQSAMAALAECIEACFVCGQVCTACADACLAEEMVIDLRACIRTDLDCADICMTTGRILARQTQSDWRLVQGQLQACATACQLCATECEKHANQHEHCRLCAEACRHCETMCIRLLQSVPARQR